MVQLSAFMSLYPHMLENETDASSRPVAQFSSSRRVQCYANWWRLSNPSYDVADALRERFWQGCRVPLGELLPITMTSSQFSHLQWCGRHVAGDGSPIYRLTLNNQVNCGHFRTLWRVGGRDRTGWDMLVARSDRLEQQSQPFDFIKFTRNKLDEINCKWAGLQSWIPVDITHQNHMIESALLSCAMAKTSSCLAWRMTVILLETNQVASRIQ